VSAPTDGIWIMKTAGQTNPVANLRAASGTIVTAALPAMVANQMYDVGFAYTPADGALRAFLGTGQARLSPVTLPAVPLSINISSYGAAARTMTVDYVWAAKSRAST
jgi:hypothetical protein